MASIRQEKNSKCTATRAEYDFPKGNTYRVSGINGFRYYGKNLLGPYPVAKVYLSIFRSRRQRSSIGKHQTTRKASQACA